MSDTADEAELAHFRAVGAVPTEVREELEVHLADLRQYASLEADVYGQQAFEVPTYPLPTGLAVSQGNWLATQERRRLDLGHRPIGSMVVLVESQGVKLQMLDLSATPGVSGAFVFTPALGPCMVINLSEVPARRRFTLAHEYAHFLIGSSHGDVCARGLQRDPIEVRANAFAASFLLPSSGVSAFLADFRPAGSPIAPEHVVHLAQHFGVSYEAVTWRLVSLELIDSNHRTRFLESGLDTVAAALGYRNPPGHGEPPPSRFQEVAIQAWRKELISSAKLEELLGLKPGQARRALGPRTPASKRIRRAPAAEPDWL